MDLVRATNTSEIVPGSVLFYMSNPAKDKTLFWTLILSKTNKVQVELWENGRIITDELPEENNDDLPIISSNLFVLKS
jgi:hypothetical protein